MRENDQQLNNEQELSLELQEARELDSEMFLLNIDLDTIDAVIVG